MLTNRAYRWFVYSPVDLLLPASYLGLKRKREREEGERSSAYRLSVSLPSFLKFSSQTPFYSHWSLDLVSGSTSFRSCYSGLCLAFFSSVSATLSLVKKEKTAFLSSST